MKSSAPGQLLGYSLQFPRALYHLLKSSPGDTVCVEVFGDVATLSAEGNITSEEDKSSIVGNPVTNRSTDLWKTFSNWIEAINVGELDLEKTKFILFCNQSGREGIVNQFSAALDDTKSKEAIEYAKQELCDIDTGHEIWKYYHYVVHENEVILLHLIQRFELEIGNGAGFDQVKTQLRSMHINDGQIEFVLEHLAGWVLRVVTENIAARKRVIISWEDFDQRFKVLFERVRCRELIDFTMQYSATDEKVQNQVTSRPIYLQQLEAIELQETELINEISDFLRADVNRQKWIASGIIDKDVASDFEERLKRFWENQKQRIEITERTLGEIEKGKLLLLECKSRKEDIRGGHHHLLQLQGRIMLWQTNLPSVGIPIGKASSDKGSENLGKIS